MEAWGLVRRALPSRHIWSYEEQEPAASEAGAKLTFLTWFYFKPDSRLLEAA